MGIDCTGMGGSGNVKSHSRASLDCTHAIKHVSRIDNDVIIGSVRSKITRL